MNEEITTQENVVELDTDIVKETLVDSTLNNAEYDIKTPYVTRTVNVPQQMRIPLYVNGQLKAAEELAELGLSIRQYTRLEVETAEYDGYYAANPTLAARVRRYAAILTAYGLAPTATSDDISDAILNNDTMSAEEKATASASLLALIHDIEINWNEVCPGEGLTAWAAMPKLIRFLPDLPETPEIPAETENETEGGE